MTRQVLYVAHPVAPTEAEIEYAKLSIGKLPEWGLTPISAAIQQNLQRALRWLAWLRKSFPETTFIAPWISVIQSVGGDGTPEEREAGLVDDCAVVERCDGIVLVGGMVSSGMRREMEHGAAFRESTKVLHHGMTFVFGIYDLTGLGSDVPRDLCNLSRGGVHPKAFSWAGFEAERGLICISRMAPG